MNGLLFPLRVLHGKLHDWRVKKSSRIRELLSIIIERLHHPKAVYLVLTPEHGNLGDHAIAKAEIDLLRRLSIPYIEVTGKRLMHWYKEGFLSVMNGRPIIINGGGNLGTLWFHNELMMREIAKKAPRSWIFILPNTIYYSEDENGEREKVNSSLAFNSHKHIKMYAREKTSYELMKTLYRDVSLVPDMVFSMNESDIQKKREGCLLCLRDDRERTCTTADHETIESAVHSLFHEKVMNCDMVKNGMIPVSDREKELYAQFNAFRSAELVITDRLHGMIFCAITGTPCIVIDSKSPKVRGCYEWIKDLPYIRFCDDVRKISEIYQEIPKKNWKYDSSKLLPLYESLERDIRKAVKGSKLCH